MLTTVKSSPGNNNSWADRPRISIQQNEAPSAINPNTVALPHPVVSNFQKCFPAASRKEKREERQSHIIYNHQHGVLTFFLMHEKSASLTPDRGLVDLYQKNGLEKKC